MGTAAFLERRGVEAAAAAEQAAELAGRGETVVHVSVDGALAGLIGIIDPVKPTTVEAIRRLQTDGLRILMVTGDSRSTALAVAAEVGLAPENVHAGVLPAGKRQVVAEQQAAGRVVAMSAGVTLIKGDLRAIVRARRLSRATMRNIRQNLFLAFVYNAVGVPVAAGVLYPLVGLLISPIWASAAMTLSSLSVIGNALRLRRADL